VNAWRSSGGTAEKELFSFVARKPTTISLNKKKRREEEKKGKKCRLATKQSGEG